MPVDPHRKRLGLQPPAIAASTGNWRDQRLECGSRSLGAAFSLAVSLLQDLQQPRRRTLPLRVIAVLAIPELDLLGEAEKEGITCFPRKSGEGGFRADIEVPRNREQSLVKV